MFDSLTLTPFCLKKTSVSKRYFYILAVFQLAFGFNQVNMQE